MVKLAPRRESRPSARRSPPTSPCDIARAVSPTVRPCDIAPPRGGGVGGLSRAGPASRGCVDSGRQRGARNRTARATMNEDHREDEAQDEERDRRATSDNLYVHRGGLIPPPTLERWSALPSEPRLRCADHLCASASGGRLAAPPRGPRALRLSDAVIGPGLRSMLFLVPEFRDFSSARSSLPPLSMYSSPTREAEMSMSESESRLRRRIGQVSGRCRVRDGEPAARRGPRRGRKACGRCFETRRCPTHRGRAPADGRRSHSPR